MAWNLICEGTVWTPSVNILGSESELVHKSLLHILVNNKEQVHTIALEANKINPIT
jgi:hypothetical protein